jgi:hypothetical protein
MFTFTPSGPYVRESKADAWLFEHSSFLRKHFSHNGPDDLPSKHDLVQERSSGDAFSRESKIDTALFEHSKFLRKHVKHEGDDEGIKSKHTMLRESLDGERSLFGEETGDEDVVARPNALKEMMSDDPTPATEQGTYDPPQNGAVPILAPTDTKPLAPAWQAATDTSITHGDEAYPHRSLSSMDQSTKTESTLVSEAAPFDKSHAFGDEATLRPAAAVGAGEGTDRNLAPGLIEHHPTTMESTPVVRPVSHSLMSSTRIGDGREDVEGMVGEDGDPMAR